MVSVCLSTKVNLSLWYLTYRWQYKYFTQRQIKIELSLPAFKQNSLIKSTFKEMSFYFAFVKISKGKSYMDVVVYLTNFYEESHLHPYSTLNFAIKVEKWSLFFVLIFSCDSSSIGSNVGRSVGRSVCLSGTSFSNGKTTVRSLYQMHNIILSFNRH